MVKQGEVSPHSSILGLQTVGLRLGSNSLYVWDTGYTDLPAVIYKRID